MSCESLIKRLPDSFVATNLPGVYAAKPLAEHFDWRNPNETYRKRHGIIWSHLDEERAHPTRAAAWKTASSLAWNPTQHLIPEFAVSAGVRKRLLPTLTDAISNSWTGVVCQNFLRQTLYDLTITAQWIVPEVSKPVGRTSGTIVGLQERGWDSSTWIGIDGYSTSSTDVLQAGVQHYVTLDGTAHYVAWYEWYVPIDDPGKDYVHQKNITNFAVQPGDTVYCSVQYVNHKQNGYLVFNNVTTGQYFAILLEPPQGASFNGASMEWILEAPGGGWPDGGVLPDFGSPVTFTQALGCGSAVGDVVDPNSGTLVTLQEGNVVGAHARAGYDPIDNNTVTIAVTAP
jgi:hypothetical protein